MHNDGAFVRLAARLLRSRWFVRAPIMAFRLGFGWLFASRLLLLEHVGRTSGERRYVALECVERPDPRTVYVASGFGDTSHWYRNVATHPHVRVSIGSIRRRPARAVLLDADESRAVLADYGREHSKTLEKLISVVRAARADHRADIRVVRLELAAS